MGKYGVAAVMAAHLCQDTRELSPRAAWRIAVAKVFPSSKSAHKKNWPRCAFLGLCENGLIPGIPEGQYCISFENKGYALRAVELIIENESLAKDEDELWHQVIQGKKINPKHQMEVVVALWNAGLISDQLHLKHHSIWPQELQDRMLSAILTEIRLNGGTERQVNDYLTEWNNSIKKMGMPMPCPRCFLNGEAQLLKPLFDYSGAGLVRCTHCHKYFSSKYDKFYLFDKTI